MQTTSQSRHSSGLFPSGPARPVLRESHPVRPAAVLAGAATTAVWLIAAGLLATSTRGYVVATATAALAAWICAWVLARFGDRGVATGVALTTAIGVSITVAVVASQWLSDLPLR